jgi:hypothetical protein
MDTGEDYPLVFSLVVGNDKGSQPYKPGTYTLDPSSFRQGRFGDLEIDPYNLALVPAG